MEKNMKKKISKALMLSLLVAAAANAQLKVDFQKSGASTATYYEDFSVDDGVVFTKEINVTIPEEVLLATSRYAPNLTVTVNVDDNTPIRSSSRTSTTNKLLDDWIGVDGRGTGSKTMTVTISGLGAGLYNWKSYHDDPDAAGFSLMDSTIFYTMDHAGTQVSGSFLQSEHLGDTVDFSFASDGSDVVFTMVAEAEMFGVFNGFDITTDQDPIPAPPPVIIPDTWLKKVDFQKTGGVIKIGYHGISLGDRVSFTAVGTYTNPPAVTLVTVTLGIDDGENDKLLAFNRGVSSDVLLDDWIGVDGRGTGPRTMTVTLSGLPAGSYDWKSYHDDSSADGTSLMDSNMSYTMDHAGTQVSGSFFQSEHLGDTVDFSFISDGMNDVVFTMVADVDTIAIMNGFSFATIYDIWAAVYGLTEGEQGDDDGDTLSNLYEFGVGGNPTNASDRGYVPTLRSAGTEPAAMEYIYHRRIDYVESQVVYLLQHSPDLVTPSWTINDFTLEGTEVVDDDYEAVTKHLPMSTDPQQFIRLSIGR